MFFSASKAFIIFSILISVSFAQNNKTKKLEVSVNKLSEAMVKGDSLVLNEIVSEKLSYGHSSGAVDNKKQFIDKLASGLSDFVSIDLQHQTVMLHKNTAYVRHQLNAITNDGGKAGEVNLWVLQVWQKEKRKWKLMARQAVKINK